MELQIPNSLQRTNLKREDRLQKFMENNDVFTIIQKQWKVVEQKLELNAIAPWYVRGQPIHRYNYMDAKLYIGFFHDSLKMYKKMVFEYETTSDPKLKNKITEEHSNTLEWLVGQFPARVSKRYGDVPKNIAIRHGLYAKHTIDGKFQYTDFTPEELDLINQGIQGREMKSSNIDVSHLLVI